MTQSVSEPSSRVLEAPAVLLPPLSDLARDAGAAIMEIYARADLGERAKPDQSPVTDADHAAEAVILAGLQRLTPDVPVVAEEEVAAGRVPVVAGRPFWLVDPLDGTKEFLRRNGEFTVNIALVEHGRLLAGVVLAPASGRLWRGGGGIAEEVAADGAARRIQVRPVPAAGATVYTSRTHGKYSDLDIWLQRQQVKVGERKIAGSSLKFCLIAAGEADLYPRFGPTSEWDTAAGQAVLEAAGGSVRREDGTVLDYGKPGFKNPWFIARGGMS
ncbi:3'(2'),5'-bisphosphate nucleotidase CysQ [Vineibacter terrae]|uniref:3'(2'),5'-bisphosphate nucleotidase CysQ n=1 Tax=Vineibacter terrae TaxID=2586908 RepID=A0A5C8PKI7_9HYPH|nr:3'(2'),5'-bisphosphate nucleotidase CysQ [Vineibacter terrae]